MQNICTLILFFFYDFHDDFVECNFPDILQMPQMKGLYLGVVLACWATVAVVKSSPETTEHGAHKPKHYVDDFHNPVFDQEALLGTF